MEKIKVITVMALLSGLIIVNIYYGADRWSSLIVEILLWATALNYAWSYVRGQYHDRNPKNLVIPGDLKLSGEKVFFTREEETGKIGAFVRLELQPPEMDRLVDVKVVFQYILEDIEIVSQAALSSLTEKRTVDLPLRGPEDAETLLYALDQSAGRYMVEVSYTGRSGQRMRKICELHPQAFKDKELKIILEKSKSPVSRIEKAVHLLCKAWILTAMHPMHGRQEEAGEPTP
ncbi:hypothetical protein JXR74_07315 [Candidatus Mcinerneyibacteriota bacterium]|nr:hypothetical protein [Candidatus Mcinerneyibacteriota bacterium]